MMAEYLDAFADIPSPGNLQPCESCGRNFNIDTLDRHENICRKLKARKPFDSSKQRLGGVVPADMQKVIKSPDPPSLKSKKHNWKQKHEDFINTIRSARGVTAAIKKGEPLPPPPPTTINPDYVQCPHCSRRFNEHAAERHIEFCKEQKSRIGKSPSSAAKSRVAARTQYKPPPPSKKNSPAPVQTTKTKQPSSKPSSGTTEYKPSKYEKQAQPVKNQATKPHSANSKTMLNKQAGKQRDGVVSAGVTKPNGHAAHKAQYSNRYKTKDNYMEVLDNDADERPLNITREVKHGRRASKPRNGSLDDLPDEVEKMILFEKTHESTRRNISIKDPSPTLFDDFHHNTSTTKTSTKNKKPPFPSKAQVHNRPSTDGYHKSDIHVDGARRLSKFCYECGSKYPVEHAKFCCECGTKRPFMNT